MTAHGDTPATVDLWAELAEAEAAAWAEARARFLHPSSYTPDTDNEENDE